MESALPTSQSLATMLTPEEVFEPIPLSTRTRSELTPTQKRSLHNRQRKMKKKARDALEKNMDQLTKKTYGLGAVKMQKQSALENIVKTGKGVTVLGKNKESSGKNRKHK